MTFYMIRDRLTDTWYKRGPAYGETWVEQERASVWTEMSGPRGCLGTIAKRNKRGHMLREPKIVAIAANDYHKHGNRDKQDTSSDPGCAA